MSERYPGGFISKNAPTVSTSGAQGVWTLEQQAAYQKAGQWPFGGPFNYIEDVFSTWLYTGTGGGTDQAISNGIDLAGKGGLVWLKPRSITGSHTFTDTARGASAGYLSSNNTNAQSGTDGGFTFNSNGFNVRDYSNGSTYTFASWTFRKQPKFFDVVTYTGNGVAGRQISHSLGATPGFMIVKNLTQAYGWMIYHRSLGGTQFMELQTTAAASAWNGVWYDTNPTSTAFTVGSSVYVNNNGDQYVAYLFAHDAGGFGTAGTDNVISCGSFTTDSTGLATVTLGYEPQWILYKKSATTSDWTILDTMRGMAITTSNILAANTSAAEVASANLLTPTATGFVAPSAGFSSNTDYIYIAIRRGPMKTPTSGTSVFNVQTYTGNNASNRIITTNFPIDANLTSSRNSTANPCLGARLFDGMFETYDTGIPYASLTDWINYDSNTGYTLPTAYQYSNNSSYNYVSASFRRAPSFHDVVCYTYSSGSPAQSHNLGVVPELMIFKCRDSAQDWYVYHKDVGVNDYLVLNSTSAKGTSGWITALTSSSFTASLTNLQNYVAYLFASCPGVSKVGSYTGTGGTQTISCGFAARWLMIKRTDSTGNWWVWDTARGMVAGTDPRIQLNTTTAEQNANWVYTDASGFQIVTTDATVNANGGSYIYLAIA